MAKTQQRAPEAGAVAVQQAQAVAQNAFIEELRAYSPSFRDVLPPEITVEFFVRVIITACAQNPDLIYANRRTLFLSCVKAASDGLLPDGREGALVVYNTEVSQRDPETGVQHKRRIDAVQWMPMIYGIRKRLRNSGEVLSLRAEAVYSNDQFAYRLGDDEFIEHSPPPLSEDRGELIGAYAIIRLRNGEILRDVLGKKEIEAARAVSRAKDGPMWTRFPWEAYKKTAARRCSKQAPLSAMDRRVLDRDDEPAIPDHMIDQVAGDQPAAEPEPQRQPARPQQQPRQEQRQPEFAVVDQDGVEHIFHRSTDAADALSAALRECRSLPALEGLWESNEALVDSLHATGASPVAGHLAQEYQELLTEWQQKAKAKEQPAAGARLGLAAPTEQALPGAVSGGGTVPRERAQLQSGAEGSEARVADPAANRPAESEQRNGEPLSADSAGNDEGPIPGSDDEPAERKSKHIPPINNRGGRQGFDWEVWARVMFLPKVRKERDSTELAFLLGDNEENIAACRERGALDADNLRQFNEDIDKANREAK